MSFGDRTSSSSDSASEQRAERADRGFQIPSLVDEDLPDESPRSRSGDGATSSGQDEDQPSSSARPVRRRRQRRPVVRRAHEYFQCDNDAGIFPSWCTDVSIEQTRSAGAIPDGVQIIIPTMFERPWDCPLGYVCLYESYFRYGRLWFPLPDPLVRYCWERRIAISQLTCSSVVNLISLMLIGEELDVPITLRFLEETCMVKKAHARNRIFYLSTKTRHKLITHARGQNVKDWERFYFFAKIDEQTSTSPPSSFFRRWVATYG